MFLYGDSTPSRLESNYIAFLSDALDLAVAILQADASARGTVGRREQARVGAGQELSQLRSLSANLGRLLAGIDQQAGALTREAAGRIRQAAEEALREASSSMKKQLQNELSQLEQRSAQEREVILKALEAFLSHNDLPDTSHRLLIKLNQNGTRAELSGHTASEVDWEMVLNIPSESLYSAPFRVEKLAEGLEIQVPELTGMVRKSVKLRPHKLANKWITEVSVVGLEGHIKLRTSLDDHSEGYDILIGAEDSIQVVRVNREACEPFEPQPEDGLRLMKLFRELARAGMKMNKYRGSLVSATLEGKTFADHPDPSVLCQRLVARMAPVVKEISERSMSRDELVLKRIVGDHRREEIFCSKRELRNKIAQAPEETRGVFVPLGLGEAQPRLGSVPEPTMVDDSSVTRVNQQPAPELHPML